MASVVCSGLGLC